MAGRSLLDELAIRWEMARRKQAGDGVTCVAASVSCAAEGKRGSVKSEAAAGLSLGCHQAAAVDVRAVCEFPLVLYEFSAKDAHSSPCISPSRRSPCMVLRR